MNAKLRIVQLVAATAAIVWLTGFVLVRAGADRSTASMLLLLSVLGVAAIGEWYLAVAASVVGSLAFSYYFVEKMNSFRIETTQGAVTFVALFITATIGSQLSIRAQREKRQALARREEMAKLQKLGTRLLGTDTLDDAAKSSVSLIIAIFLVQGADLRIDGRPLVSSGETTGPSTAIPLTLNSAGTRDILKLYGNPPSDDVCHALVSLLSLVFERARSAEEREKIRSSQRGDELRTTVLNALAHGFRTPLTSIKAAASALLNPKLSPNPRGRELVAVIDEEADRLDQLIGESLNLARIESHRENPRREECFLPEIVERVRLRMSRYLGRREFVVQVSDDLPPITADRFLLEQMLIQVVDNAWKYSRPGSRILVSAEISDTGFILSVENEGSEIAESERSLIFDKFYRGGGEQGSVEGTGLGLAIARSIAESFDGRVWLDMEPSGPAFRFSLPWKSIGEERDFKAHYSVN